MDRRNNGKVNELLKANPGAVVFRDGGANPEPLAGDIRKLREAGNLTEVIVVGHIDCGWVKKGAAVLYFGQTASADLRAEYNGIFKNFKPAASTEKAKKDKKIAHNLYREMEVYALGHFVGRLQDIVGSGIKVKPMMIDARKSPANAVHGEDNIMVITPPSSTPPSQLAEEVRALLRKNGADLVINVDTDKMYVVSTGAARHAELSPDVHVTNIVLFGKNRTSLQEAERAIKSVTGVPTTIVIRERKKSAA
jgi:hypothetical protein